jgi:hypothetical protein
MFRGSRIDVLRRCPHVLRAHPRGDRGLGQSGVQDDEVGCRTQVADAWPGRQWRTGLIGAYPRGRSPSEPLAAGSRRSPHRDDGRAALVALHRVDGFARSEHSHRPAVLAHPLLAALSAQVNSQASRTDVGCPVGWPSSQVLCCPARAPIAVARPHPPGRRSPRGLAVQRDRRIESHTLTRRALGVPRDPVAAVHVRRLGAHGAGVPAGTDTLARNRRLVSYACRWKLIALRRR